MNIDLKERVSLAEALLALADAMEATTYAEKCTALERVRKAANALKAAGDE